MKVKILRDFLDKETKAIMKADSTAEYEEERANELIKKGFAEKAGKVKEETKEEKPAKKTTKKTKKTK